jgi:glycine cleavage system H protein
MADSMKYTSEHEWLKIEGGDVAVIGITAFAQDALGDLVYVELPEVGRKVAKGEDFAVVESVKTAAEVYSPVSGEIVAVNDNLSSDPELIKKSFEEGWIAKIKIKHNAEIESLMDKAAYEAFLKTQDH